MGLHKILWQWVLRFNYASVPQKRNISCGILNLHNIFSLLVMWITVSSHAVYPFTMPLMTWSTPSTATCLFLLWSVSLMWICSVPMVTIFTLCITFLIPFYPFFFFWDRTFRTSLSEITIDLHRNIKRIFLESHKKWQNTHLLTVKQRRTISMDRNTYVNLSFPNISK